MYRKMKLKIKDMIRKELKEFPDVMEVYFITIDDIRTEDKAPLLTLRLDITVLITDCITGRREDNKKGYARIYRHSNGDWVCYYYPSLRGEYSRKFVLPMKVAEGCVCCD